MNLQKLQQQRNAYRQLIDRFLEDIESVTVDQNIQEFVTRLECLESKVSQLQTLSDKVLTQVDSDGFEEEFFSTENYSLSLNIRMAKLQDVRNHLQSASSSGILSQIPSSGEQQQQQQIALQQNGNAVRSADTSSQFYRLPKLSLPTFDGDVLKWQSFWDSFECTIHANPSLTDVQKFAYLQSQLEGNAARVIAGFALTNVNYTRAVELLQERYGQTHKITHASMQALLALPKPSSRVDSLRLFYDSLETHIRSLEARGDNQDTFGTLLVPIILDKLPSEVRQNLARVNGDNDWKLQFLRTALNKEIKILEAGETTRTQEIQHSDATALFHAGARPKNKPLYQSKETRYTNTDKKQLEIKCALCANEHKSNDCLVYPDTASRLEIVKQKRLCFNCLGNHQIAKCNSIKICQICKRKHHTAICNSKTSQGSSDSQNTENRKTERHFQNTEHHNPERPNSMVMHSSSTIQDNVLLKTAIATVSSDSVQADASILFDEGSQKSFITEKLAQELALNRGTSETIHLSAFGSTSEKTIHVDTATVHIETTQRKKIPIKVLIVPTIGTPIDIRMQKSASNLPYLRGLKLAHPVTEQCAFNISMLIGADSYWTIVEDHVVRGDGPTAVRSKIGYLLSGPIHAKAEDTSNHVFNVMTSGKPDTLEKFWQLESLGITHSDDEIEKTDYFKDYQDSSIQFKDGSYSAKLPWKHDHSPLPSNIEVAKTRTQGLIKRLQKEPGLLETYDGIMQEQERRGFIEKVTEDAPPTGQVHYIPHHAVKKDSSTTPIRIVFDCSCRQSSHLPSLNDCLESTPPILNDLSAILVRFRMHKYAVTTDIEKAFLHVALDEADRDATRFLWLSDIQNPNSPLCVYRFKAVLFGATCSPFMLSATILKHLELNKHVPSAEIIERDLYVDNILSSFENESELCTYYAGARALMSDASMNLRSWASNSEKLQTQAVADAVLDKDVLIKTLGMRWDPNTDSMSFAERRIPALSSVTKRLILKYSSQIYDPLGLLSPVTVRAKILLQELWKSKYDWDIPLPQTVQDTWNELATDLNTVTTTQFSRHLLTSVTSNSDTCLHVFVDASVKSYGAAAYLSDQSSARLVMAKNRVAPLKTLTLPQLELMAALIGARLASHLSKTLNAKNIVFWSDSQIVLHWLTTEKPMKRFVRNRVDEIRQLSGGLPWRYCPTDDNPADLLTRGIRADDLLASQLWDTGPTWLTHRMQWPIWEYNQTHAALDDDAETSTPTIPTPPITVSSLQCTDTLGVHNIVDVTRHGTYSKLLRVTAYVSRFVVNCRRQRPDRLTGSLSSNELQDAEMRWLTSCQSTNFRNEIDNLHSKERRLPLVRQLRLYLDSQGHIRCGGRIHNAPVEELVKFPYLLPGKHALTKLIIEDAHRDQLHAGLLKP